MREKGQSEEEIAAAFFVAVSVVKQRLRLASVSPKLLDVYAEDGITLDQLMAFTVNGDHERQEQVFERLRQSYSKEPHAIRRMLTEGAVRAADKRAQFVGVDAYTNAGGVVMRDLFQGDDGGWLQDVGLLDRLVAEQLHDRAEAIRAEGWKWIEVAPDFAYGHTYGLRQLRGEQVPLTEEEQAARDALQAEMDRLEETYAEADEVPEEVDQRLGEIETALAAFDDRPVAFDPEDVSRAGAFVSIDGSGGLRVERGYVRPEDELPIEPEAEAEGEHGAPRAAAARAEHDQASVTAEPEATAEPEEDEGLKPIPDRLMTELTAHRTLALRHALGEHPDVAFTAALHALCLKAFYRYAQDTCLELDLKSAGFSAQAPGLQDSALANAFDARHQAWVAALPQGTGRPLGCADRVRRRQPAGPVRPLRLAVAQCGLRSLQPQAPRARSCRPDRRGPGSRHGRGRLDPDGRELSRPRHQGPHPWRGAGSEGRTGRSAHRPSQEDRDGGEGAGTARRVRLAAGAAAHAGPQPP